MADLQLSKPTLNTTDAPNPEREITKHPSISDLQSDSIFPTLWYRLHVLLFDLEHFQNDSESRQRLESVTDISYIGEPYFNSSESSAIKNTMIDTKTLSRLVEENLQERLQRRMKKRVDSGDYRVCAAHDFAPILATALGIDLKQLGKDKGFTALIKKHGLNWDEKWSGLTKKPFAPKQKKKKR